MGLLNRPELGERRAVVRQALLALQGGKVLPFSPTVLVGFSAGGFGGGSNLVGPSSGGSAAWSIPGGQVGWKAAGLCRLV